MLSPRIVNFFLQDSVKPQYQPFQIHCPKNYRQFHACALTEHVQLLNLGRNCALSMLSDSSRFFAICKIE